MLLLLVVVRWRVRRRGAPAPASGHSSPTVRRGRRSAARGCAVLVQRRGRRPVERREDRRVAGLQERVPWRGGPAAAGGIAVAGVTPVGRLGAEERRLRRPRCAARRRVGRPRHRSPVLLWPAAAARPSFVKYLYRPLEPPGRVFRHRHGPTGLEPHHVNQVVCEVLRAQLDVLEVLEDSLCQLLLLAVRVEALGLENQQAACLKTRFKC